MSFLDRLERALGRFAIHNLSLYLIVGQVFVLLAVMFQRVEPELLSYAPVLVKQGEWWRMFTFVFLPQFPSTMFGYVFLAFGWYLFYLMGSALESYWGAFRFNVFLFMSYALTVGLTFFAPLSLVTNIYIVGSVFLAFAYLNPDFELTLFFILPVKIKWLALLTWALNLAAFILGGRSTRLQILASVCSFLLFFGADLMRRLGVGKEASRSRRFRAEAVKNEEEPRHRCHVCGKTDRSHPQMDFRYCSQCAGDQCYCEEHIRNHTHVTSAHESQKK